MTEARAASVHRADAVRVAAATLSGFLELQTLLAGGTLPLPAGVDESVGKVLAYENLGARVAGCTRCGLASARSRVVFSGGNPLARVLLVGEAPGVEEDASGKPVAGEAGRLLDKILASIKLTRRDICITNIVKCRPPGNRDPLPEEIAACSAILELQLSLLQPAIICTLGRVAAQSLLGVEDPLRSLRGRWHRRGGADLIATHHPASLLQDELLKRDAWSDVQKLRQRYARMIE